METNNEITKKDKLFLEIMKDIFGIEIHVTTIEIKRQTEGGENGE